MAFDAQKVAAARKIIDAALKEAGQIIGAEIKMGNIRFNDNMFRTQITATRIDGETGEITVDPNKEYKAKRAISLYSGKLVSQNRVIIGSTCEVMGIGEVRIIDFNSRAKKVPFIVETPTGVKYRTAVSTLRLQDF